ncbi:class I SAM-dependent methyltransferase [Magnetospira sp. QH-2]|uniref:class I SAM-dependent methyltransferase n=1 Tax=Magnetospira sp. (strain QH-2) TaxID=1288970 RepID=UPI0003E80A68|nr:class I SAM-dependent methyltransferase [Magnetospira sp. QH-2]CCQ73139.1 Ubiquinone/menaquinone biosynthesis methyltransferase ubiE [Magnetospira sp. QH-2]
MTESRPIPTRSKTPDLARHRASIQAMFALVAPRYDRMNDLMSMGIHRLWKRRLLRSALRGGMAVDLAGGTGDIARLLVRRGFQAVVCDPSVPMMQGGSRDPALRWVAGVGEDLPFADGSVDLVTVGFGLRNMSEPERALAEALRVLKPGGQFLCLEFSKPAGWLAPFYDLYSRHGIPRIGALVAGKREAYEYLVESIREFPDQETLKGMMQQAGFEAVTYDNLSFGIAAIHAGRKPAS